MDMPAVARSGGHSYAGYSTTQGLVIDMSRMNLITDHRDGSVSVEAGAPLGQVDSQLTAKELILPAGRCASVGIAGLALGGGFGFNSRKFGLTSDNLLEAEIVTADGELRPVDETSDPDLLWALLFVSAVGIGALSGLLALFFFSIAVTTKLTSDTLDGIDMGPIEAANASGASLNQMLRTAVVPQILPSYASFVLYNFELNLRASAVLGLVGAGGIGARIEFFRGRGDWEELWGLVVMFFLVVFVVERLSVTLRRRLI